jgi:hypothetical protein
VFAVLAITLEACGGGGSGAPQMYSVGGSVSGLSGAGLQLQSAGAKLSVSANGAFTFPAQGGSNVSISANGPFSFTEPVGSGSSYQIAIISVRHRHHTR